MDIRQLRYLIALVREEHFTRAAEVCNVTQPTLSGRIRQLEEELGVPIVIRGHKYHGLTPEGEHVLRWARRIVEDCDAMREDLAMLASAPEGRIRLGVIPSALPTTAPLTSRLQARYPRVNVEIHSQNSRQILQSVQDFGIDAGITYLDNEPVELGRTWPLYRERYRLFIRDDHPLAARPRVRWAEAAEHPLCALTTDMQNRRIIDAAFARARVTPRPAVESNSMLALCAHVQAGRFACVLPESYLAILGGANRVRALPLVEPTIGQLVGIVALDSDPQPALLGALITAASEIYLDDGEEAAESIDDGYEPIEAYDL